jgi:hypothetical protein
VPIKGTFCSTHLIGSGLKTLFEGDTVCYPTGNLAASGLEVFAQSTVFLNLFYLFPHDLILLVVLFLICIS